MLALPPSRTIRRALETASVYVILAAVGALPVALVRSGVYEALDTALALILGLLAR